MKCGVHMTNTYAALEDQRQLDKAREQEEAVVEQGRTEEEHGDNWVAI